MYYIQKKYTYTLGKLYQKKYIHQENYTRGNIYIRKIIYLYIRENILEENIYNYMTTIVCASPVIIVMFLVNSCLLVLWQPSCLFSFSNTFKLYFGVLLGCLVELTTKSWLCQTKVCLEFSWVSEFMYCIVLDVYIKLFCDWFLCCGLMFCLCDSVLLGVVAKQQPHFHSFVCMGAVDWLPVM